MVTAQRLNVARAEIETQTGASTYTITSEAIAATPGGENVQLNQVLLQAPDVVQDSFGQLHVRADHNDLQYRLNGIILPEGISVFSQTLSPRLISSLSLITGALPAEYGLRTAGIIDLTTNSGLLQPGGYASVYGGSFGTFQPAAEYGGSAGSFSYYVTGDYKQNNLGIESPDGSARPAARPHHPVSRLQLLRGHSRSEQPPVADHRQLRRLLRDPQSARSRSRRWASTCSARANFSATTSTRPSMSSRSTRS